MYPPETTRRICFVKLLLAIALLWSSPAASTSISDRVVDCGAERCAAYDVSPYGNNRSETCRGSVITSGRQDVVIFEIGLCPTIDTNPLKAESAFCFSSAPSQHSNPVCVSGSISNGNISSANFGRPPCTAAVTGCKHNFILEIPFLELETFGFKIAPINGTNDLIGTGELHLCVFYQAAGSLADWAVQCAQSFFLSFRFNVDLATLVFKQWKVSSSVNLVSPDTWGGEVTIADVSHENVWPARLEDCVLDNERSTLAADLQRIPPYDTAGIHRFSLSGPAPDGMVSGDVWILCSSSTYESGVDGYVTGEEVRFAVAVLLEGKQLVAETTILWEFELTTGNGQPLDASALVGSAERVYQRLSIGGASRAAADCDLQSLDFTHADRGGQQVTKRTYNPFGVTQDGEAIGFRFEGPMDNGSCDYVYSVRPGAFAFYGGRVVWEADVVVRSKQSRRRGSRIARSGQSNTETRQKVTLDILQNGDIIVSSRTVPAEVPPVAPSEDSEVAETVTPMWIWIVATVAALLLGFALAAVTLRRRVGGGAPDKRHDVSKEDGDGDGNCEAGKPSETSSDLVGEAQVEIQFSVPVRAVVDLPPLHDTDLALAPADEVP